MFKVKCRYCGSMIAFKNAVHREEASGDFMEYFHFCDNRHLNRWLDVQKHKKASPATGTIPHTGIL